MSQPTAASGAVLRRQQALITTAQAGAAGVGREACSDLVRRGIWERPYRGLYGPAGVPWTWKRRLMAAVLLGPEGTLASHRSSAALLGVGGIDDPLPEVTIPRGGRLRRRGFIVHESTDLHLAEIRRIDGIPTTGPRRLAMDLGSVVSEARYRQTMREIRFRHQVSADALLRTYLRHRRSGRSGGAALRDWLDRYYHLGAPAESGLEQVALDAFLDAGLAPTPQLWVDAPGARRYRIDLAFPALMIAVEVDGSQHEDGPVRVADVRREAALEALGWTVIRIRAGTFASDLHRAIALVRSAGASSGVS